MRTDGDGHGYGCPDAGGSIPWHFYYQTYSRDWGRTWSQPRPIPGAGSVRPRLLLLESGALVLSGGRMCTEQAEHAPPCLPVDQASGGGIFLWVNLDGSKKDTSSSPPSPPSQLLVIFRSCVTGCL